MHHFFTDLDSSADGGSEDSDSENPEQLHSLTTALLAFDACRSHASRVTGFMSTARRVSESEVIKREPLIQEEILQIHEALAESEQLRIYGFYLTAVHRNSVISTRFHPTIVSSHERTAAIEAEYDDISNQLDEIVNEVAARSIDRDKKAARLFAADFLWTVAWWVHARRDVLSFAFDRMEDPLVNLLLGRAPDPSERVSRDMYAQAAAAELDYRRHVRENVDVRTEPKASSPMVVDGENHL